MVYFQISTVCACGIVLVLVFLVVVVVVVVVVVCSRELYQYFTDMYFFSLLSLLLPSCSLYQFIISFSFYLSIFFLFLLSSPIKLSSYVPHLSFLL